MKAAHENIWTKAYHADGLFYKGMKELNTSQIKNSEQILETVSSQTAGRIMIHFLVLYK